MTKEQKERADKLQRDIHEVKEELTRLTLIKERNQRTIVVRDSHTYVTVPERLSSVLYTLLNASYTNELEDLEAEFAAL